MKKLNVILLALLVFALTGCPKEPVVTYCECPDGSLHLTGETCCSADVCGCETNVAGERIFGIPVTNRGGDINTVKGHIQSALQDWNDYDPTIVLTFKNMVKEISIVASVGEEGEVLEKGKYIIKIQKDRQLSEIQTIISDFINEKGIYVAFQQGKDNVIRIAFQKQNGIIA